jgi:mono/diheme cytochrome c family protein
MLKLLSALPALLFLALLPRPSALAPAQDAAPAQPSPADAAKMVNPVTPTPESQAHAKDVWGYDCAMCHNTNGNGKGDIAGPLKLVNIKDFTDPAALKDIPDGELFLAISNGKGQMPPEAGRAKPDDIWNLVIFVRSLSKNQPPNK